MIAHARISEFGSAWGEPGDQTGHEVEVTPWVDKKWIAVYRFKDRIDAHIAAELITSICNNQNVGYSQNNGASPRTSLLDELIKHNWDVSKIGKCNCDCSSLIAAVCIYLGYNVDRDMYTGSEDYELMKSGKFEKLTHYKYLSSDTNLMEGDILLCNGHTAMQVSDYDYIATGDVFIRTAPVDGETITYIPKGCKVESLSNPWVKVKYNGHEGWSSLKYL